MKVRSLLLLPLQRNKNQNLIYVSIIILFFTSSLSQSSELGAEIWRGFMGVWKTIYENFRYKKCEYLKAKFYYPFFILPYFLAFPLEHENKFGVVTKAKYNFNTHAKMKKNAFVMPSTLFRNEKKETRGKRRKVKLFIPRYSFGLETAKKFSLLLFTFSRRYLQSYPSHNATSLRLHSVECTLIYLNNAY